MDFQSTLDYVATVGYDVDFLRGETRDLLVTNPIATGSGSEHFDPRRAPQGALAATGPWAARLIQGGGTLIDELGGGSSWSGSLDLPASARRVGEMVRGWMGDEVSRETELIGRAGTNNPFPVGAPAAEQFYSLRDSIHFSEQWLPGTAASRPALTLLLAFCIGVDEFFCPLDALDTTPYLGRAMGGLWDDCRAECGGGADADAAGWLGLARDALRSSVFLQNREKLAHLGLVAQDGQVFTDWDTTAHYMLRAEAAMTPFVGFCLCAYAGLPFRADLAGAVGVYCYGNAFVLDFCKRATRLGGGNYTEVALGSGSGGELQGRSHLIAALLAYGESVLPALFLTVLRPYVLATSSVVDVLDRYRERSWGCRLPVGPAMLGMMEAVMEGAGASWGGSTSTTSPSRQAQLAADVIEANDAWDAYRAYAAQPSVDAWYRLPRLVRHALERDGLQLQLKLGSQPPPTTNGSSTVLPVPGWMDCLCVVPQPPTPAVPPELARGPPTTPNPTRLPPVRKMASTGLDAIIVRSPARPGGHAAGHREFIGRPAGAGPTPL